MRLRPGNLEELEPASLRGLPAALHLLKRWDGEAAALFGQGRHEEARQLLERMLEVDPRHVVTYLGNLGRLHFRRCAGLQVGGFPAGQNPALRGLFRRDAAAPEANGRPHWSTAEGGHLYYATDGSWYLNNVFTPGKTTCAALFATDGEVPVGDVAWQYYDGSKWIERALTMTEQLPQEDGGPV